MLVSIRNKQLLCWHEEQHVFVYDSDNKCLTFCQIKDLDLYSNRYGALYNIIESDVYLESADENKNLCQPKEKYFPPDCVGPRECPYPGVCYRFETDQQDYECGGSESAEEDSISNNETSR